MGKTVLLVDDVITCLEPVAAALRMSGYRVLCASDGMKAWEIIEESFPDIVVMDLALPRMSGPDLVREIRTSAVFHRLPVIIFSGSSPQDAMGAMNDLLVDACLVKGRASMAELRAAIDVAIQSRARTAA